VRFVRHVIAALALIAGIGFLWISNTYWALPADQLPPWLPGHKAHSHPEHGHHHTRHGSEAFLNRSLTSAADATGALLRL
jgi:hypothetical protein